MTNFIYDQSADNYRIHYHYEGRHRRISCPLATMEDAERWIVDWKSVGPEFENCDLRIHAQGDLAKIEADAKALAFRGSTLITK